MKNAFARVSFLFGFVLLLMLTIKKKKYKVLGITSKVIHSFQDKVPSWRTFNCNLITFT